jgi:hypothetical protein
MAKTSISSRLQLLFSAGVGSCFVALPPQQCDVCTGFLRDGEEGRIFFEIFFAGIRRQQEWSPYCIIGMQASVCAVALHNTDIINKICRKRLAILQMPLQEK